MSKSTKSLILTILMIASAMAGCLDGMRLTSILTAGMEDTLTLPTSTTTGC